MGKRFGCPECGGEYIKETNSVLVDYDITAWDDDGTPLSYGDSEVLWDSVESYREDPYICGDCDAHFSEPKKLDA